MRRALASARWLLAALVLTTACSNPALRRTADVGGVRVSVGTIESSRLHTSLTRPEGTLPEQLEDLFDLFWAAGCGEQLRLTTLSDIGYPEVVCRLPGRSKSLIVVFAHIDLDPADSEVVDDWASAASLPTLYRSLGTEAREHTFVFTGFGEVSRRRERTWRSIRRLADAADAKIHAVVDLRRLLSGHHGIWYYSANQQLRDYLFTVGLAVGRSPDSLRLFVPPDRERRSGKARRLMGRIPAITIGTFAAGDAAAVASAPPDAAADGGEVLRLVAFFLGYIDQKLAVEPTPAEDLDSAESPTRSID